MWGFAIFVWVVEACLAITAYLYSVRHVPARGEIYVRSGE